MGYNPINGESYSTKDGLNSKIEQLEIKDNETESNDTVKIPDEEEQQGENGTDNKPNGSTTENGNSPAHTDAVENGNSQAPVDKPSTNGHSIAKVR